MDFITIIKNTIGIIIVIVIVFVRHTPVSVRLQSGTCVFTFIFSVDSRRQEKQQQFIYFKLGYDF